MYTFINRGNRINTEIGTDEQPELIRWTTWNEGGQDIQQSFALKSSEGVVWVDPVRPKNEEALRILDKLTDGKSIAVVCTTPLHERNIYWFREKYGASIFIPKNRSSEFNGTPDSLFEDGDILPGEVKALWIGERQKGEMVLHWRSPEDAQVLICGDAIYGQSRPGAFDGGPEDFWHQVGGIRLFSGGHIEESQMRRQYECLLDLEFDSILNGHNPNPIDQDPKGALLKVLQEGTYEIRGCTYLWLDLLKGQEDASMS